MILKYIKNDTIFEYEPETDDIISALCYITKGFYKVDGDKTPDTKLLRFFLDECIGSATFKVICEERLEELEDYFAMEADIEYQDSVARNERQRM